MANERLQLTPGEAIEIVSVTDERLEVEATYAPAGEVREYGAGEAFDVPRGTVHRMSNTGSEPALVRWTTSAAGRTLDWFRDLEATQRRVEGRKLARALASPPLLYKYRDTFRLARG